MAFIWTSPIGQSLEIYDFSLKEIRDNCDYIDDNVSCLTHYFEVFDPHYHTYDTSLYTINENSDLRSRNYADFHDHHVIHIGPCDPFGQ